MSDRRSPALRAAACLPPGIGRWPADDRAAWLARRQGDVTASAIAALIPDPGDPTRGAHPYTTARRLYAIKTGELADDEAVPMITTTSISLPPLIRGTVLEPVIPAVLKHLRPKWIVEPAGYYYRDPAARIGATPDFFVVDPSRPGLGIIQAKTTDNLILKQKWIGEDGAIEPPLFIVIQAIVEAALTGARWAAVAVLSTGINLDLHLIEIPIHLGVMARLKTAVARFWAQVEAGTPPDLDYARDGALIGDLFPRDNAQELDLRLDNRLPEIVAERDRLKAEMKRLGGEVDAIDGEVKARLGGYEAATIAGGRRISWRVEPRRSFVVPASEPRVLRYSKAS